VKTVEQIQPAIAQSRAWVQEFRVPVVVEFILERITNISMGNDINAVNEFEELAGHGEDAPTALTLLD
jgi:tartronate-semialdehyde synthase